MILFTPSCMPNSLVYFECSLLLYLLLYLLDLDYIEAFDILLLGTKCIWKSAFTHRLAALNLCFQGK